VIDHSSDGTSCMISIDSPSMGSVSMSARTTAPARRHASSG
jgi:hypothetical protein